MDPFIPAGISVESSTDSPERTFLLSEPLPEVVMAPQRPRGLILLPGSAHFGPTAVVATNPLKITF
jgi:hypothetical protein